MTASYEERVLRWMRRDQNANLRQTRDLLLPKLISGELDVEQLEIGAKAIEV